MLKVGCFVEGDCMPDCVFDDEYGGPIGDCCVATILQTKGKGKSDCEHWRYGEVDDTTHECPKCGHQY